MRRSSAFECGPWKWYRGMREVHLNKGRVGEDRGSKEMDGCPLTQACGSKTALGLGVSGYGLSPCLDPWSACLESVSALPMLQPGLW
jgi:hypothetical protein